MGRVLHDEQITRYHADGVLFPIPALGPAEVRASRQAFDAIDAEIGDDRSPDRFGQWHLCFRAAYDLATRPRILDVVEDLLGPNLLIHSSTAFIKRPRSPQFVSWHQDGFYWGLDTPRLTSAWIALSDSTQENGCLRVLIGSHRGSRIPHRVQPHEHNMLSTGLNAALDSDEAAAVDISLRAGEMSLHHVHMVHGSGPNRSDGPRVAFAVRYVSPEVTQRRTHHDVVLARGRDEHAHFCVRATPPGDSIADGVRAQRSLR